MDSNHRYPAKFLAALSIPAQFTFRNITGSLAPGTDGSNPSPSAASLRTVGPASLPRLGIAVVGHDAASHHAGGRSWVHSARMSCGVGLRCSTAAAAEGRLNDVGPKYPLILAPLLDGALESLPAIPLPTLFG
jgi:hypothetical protein